MNKRLSTCATCRTKFSRVRVGQKYCSSKCRNRAVYLDSLALNENGGGIRTPLNDAVDTKVSARTKLTLRKAQCPVCGLPTGQDFIDQWTPVYHDGCYGKSESAGAVNDRTHLFPEVYGPNPTKFLVRF